MEDILYNYGTSREEAEQLVKDFIKFKDGHRIKNPIFKEIQFWYKRPRQFIEEIKNLRNTKSKAQLIKDAKSGSELVHIDNDWVILRIKTRDASVYYGRNTKWCISMLDEPGLFEYYMLDFTIYFCIRKNYKGDKFDKVAILINKDGRIDVWDSLDNDEKDQEPQDLAYAGLLEYKDIFVYKDPVEEGLIPKFLINNTKLVKYYASDPVVIIPDNVEIIGNGAFRGRRNLRDVKLPDSVTSIEDYAFMGCTSLTSVVIGNSLTSIGSSAFIGCTSLTSVVIGNSLTSIGSSAFIGCTSLTSITIPNSATSIGNRAFGNCKSLTSIIIPDSVTSISNNAFIGCTSLTIYAEATSKPTNWDDNWNPANRPVIWGYKQKSNNKKIKKESKMRNFRFKTESTNMSVFEIENKLIEFFNKKNVHVSVSKNDDHFDIYISQYVGDKKNELPKDIDKQLQKFVNNLKPLGDKEHELLVAPTKHGMHIYIATQDDSGHLLENFGKYNKDKIKCCICEKPIIGYGNDPYPVNIGITSRACDDCNKEYVIPARLDLLRGPKVRKEATNKHEVEREASNIVLDDKYTWLFSVLADDGMDIEEGIEYMQDAIDILINKNGVYLVAFPYVDPNPEDISVDLVFADNPGPVIIYNREEATVAKDELHKPTNIKQPKTNNKEETN